MQRPCCEVCLRRFRLEQSQLDAGRRAMDEILAKNPGVMPEQLVNARPCRMSFGSHVIALLGISEEPRSSVSSLSSDGGLS